MSLFRTNLELSHIDNHVIKNIGKIYRLWNSMVWLLFSIIVMVNGASDFFLNCLVNYCYYLKIHSSLCIWSLTMELWRIPESRASQKHMYRSRSCRSNSLYGWPNRRHTSIYLTKISLLYLPLLKARLVSNVSNSTLTKFTLEERHKQIHITVL